MKKKLSDEELLKILDIDIDTLHRFQQIQKNTIIEAKWLIKNRKQKIKIVGISGSARDEYDMAQENSNSEELLKTCLKQCKKLGATTEIISLRKYSISHCKACYSTTNTQCHFYCSCYPKWTNIGDDMSNILYDKILKADGIIFATPVNNFKISTLMASFIDRCISLDWSLEPADLKHPKNKELNIKHMKFIELTADNYIPWSWLLKRFLWKVAGIIVTGHEAWAAMTISSLFMTLNHFWMVFPPFSSVYAIASVLNSTHEDKKIVLSDTYKNDVELLAKNIINEVNLARKIDPTSWVYEYNVN